MGRNVSDIIGQLELDEGFEPKVYKDSLGKFTFGNGFTSIAQDESRVVLQMKAAKVHDSLIAALPWTAFLSQPRFGVLLNMAYNMGVDGLLEWKTFLELMESGEYAEAADDLENKNPKYVAEVGARAHRLAEQLRTDSWQ